MMIGSIKKKLWQNETIFRSNLTLAGTLRQIIKRYDIILIQEIRDKSQQAINDLLDELNKE